MARRASSTSGLLLCGLLLLLAIPAALLYAILQEPVAAAAPSPLPQRGRFLAPAVVKLETLPSEIRVLRTRKPYQAGACAQNHRGRCVERVPLERYVEGVVAGEEAIFAAEPDYWPIRLSGASMKAAASEAWALQAIAARTYALYAVATRRHDRLPYDLEDTPRDQAYTDKRDPAIAAAVRRTAGQVLVDSRGRLVPTEYSASCAGRGTWNVLDPKQAIACHPRCQARAYPGSSHGRGMCQWGSFEFARDGEDLQALLSRYYPGTRPARAGRPRPIDPLRDIFGEALPL